MPTNVGNFLQDGPYSSYRLQLSAAAHGTDGSGLLGLGCLGRGGLGGLLGRALGYRLLGLKNIKFWFIDPLNKTGCRFVIVDAYNDPTTIDFYTRNDFDTVFSTEQQERDYRRIASATPLSTRLMYYDLMMMSRDYMSFLAMQL